MSVYDNIRDGKYTNNVPWDIEPVPVDEERMTVKQAREHQEEQKRLKREQRAKHGAEDGRLSGILRADLEAEHGTAGNPKAGLLWEKTWEMGHSSGYHEIACVYAELAELIT